MGILFKTYQGKHQLHVCRETWTAKNKAEMEEILKLFSKKEVVKAKITPVDNAIDLELNAMIIDCKNVEDLKHKFGVLAEMKEKYQKIMPQAAFQKPKLEHKK